MPQIQRGQFSQLLRRYLGMTGVNDVVDELAPELAADFTLEVERPEWEFLKGQKLMSAVGTIVPSVGLTPMMRLENPAASGAIGIIQPIIISSQGVDNNIDIKTNPAAGNLTTTFQSVARDTRYPTVAFPGNSALVCSGDYGTAGALIATLTAKANTALFYCVPVVLTPGFDLNVIGQTANTAMVVVFNWLEKRLDQLER